MLIKHHLSGTVIAMLLAAPAYAQYPEKTVRIVTSGAGGAGDVASRIIAEGISKGLGRQVVVDNRASGLQPVEAVLNAPADGYTVLLYGSSVWLAPYLVDNVPYDPLKDLVPITFAVTSPNLLVVHPSMPVKTVKDLIALARSKPGAMNYAATGIGSSPHLAGELFKAMAKVDIVRINYKAASNALTEVISGEVQLTFATASSSAPHLKAGRLRGLAVTSAERSQLLPAYPTVAESGVPGYESGSTSGMFVRTGTPPAIATRLNQEIVRFLQTPQAKEKFLSIGVEVVGSPPERLSALMKSDMTRLGGIIKAERLKATQ